MQLVLFSFILFLFVLTNDVKAQLRKNATTDKSTADDKSQTVMGLYEKPEWKTIDIDFLSSYYSQDGSHSAVTGGIGTEKLTDFTQKVIVSVPFSSKLKLNMDAGYDYYSSASTDNIDNVRSSASSHDVRTHGNIGISYQLSENNNIGFRLGGSAEYDYYSANGGVNYSWLSSDQNSTINIGLQAFIDQWELYYPYELRRKGRLLDNNKRQSYSSSIGFSQVLSKKMQFSIHAEGILMKGLLSTPFHRVYVSNEALPLLEKLPASRIKVPIGIRLNTYISEQILARLYYRYYWDNWGIKAHTANVEVPIKINRFVTIYPSYRFHKQSKADHFVAYQEYDMSSPYYSSDYDLSALTSHSIGGGISFSPAGGIAKIKIPFTQKSALKIASIDLKYDHYMRSTDLRADIVSLGISFKL